MSDRLALANAIEDGGIERGKAERIASVIFDAIHDNAATKADVEHVEAALKTDIAGVRADLRQVETALVAEIGRVADRTLIRLVGVVVVLLGILFAALKWHSS